MSQSSQDIWNALTKDGPIPIEGLQDAVDTLLTEQPNFAVNPDVNTSLLYSGPVHKLGAYDISQNLSARAGGQLGTVDMTPIGKVLGDLTASDPVLSHAKNVQAMKDRFGDRIDFGNLDDEVVLNKIYGTFIPASDSYVSQIEGRVITATPESLVNRVYAETEVPQIAEGIESGRITHVNGIESAAFKPFLDINDPEARRLAFKDAFDESFTQNLKEARPEAYRAADGKPGFIAADTKDMQILGAGDDVEMDRAARPSKGHIPSRDFIEGVESNRAATPKPASALSDDVVQARAKFDVLSDPKVKGFSVDPEMETQHYYSKAQNAVVTVDKDGGISIERGTAERPAGHIFHDRLQDAAERFPEFHEGRLPARIQGGGSAVTDAVAEINKTGIWKTLGNVAEDGGKFLGKASKLLGPVGVGAATLEAAILESKAREFEEYGALSEEAVLQYDLILVGHVGQATVDPTMVGGEALTKTAFEKWADHHGISDEMKTELAPGLLIDAVGKAGQAIYDTYDDVKGYGEDLAREVTEGLEDIVGMPSHRNFMDDMDPYHAPNNSFKDFLGLLKFSPSFGSGSWQEGALKIDGHSQEEQTLGRASIQEASFSETNRVEHPGTVALEDAIGMLAADQKALNAPSTGEQASPIQDAVNHPDAAQMFQNLHTHGVKTLTAEITPDMSAESRVSELLLAGQEATQQAGIPMPSAQRELDAMQELNNSYEDDYSFSV